PAEELYQRPIHPYTEALLSAVPIPDPDLSDRRTQIVLEGDVPSPIVPPSACRFHRRCRYATKIWPPKEPPLAEYGGGHPAAGRPRLNLSVPAAPPPPPAAAPASPPAAAAQPLPPVAGGAAGAEVPAEEAQ